MSFQVAMNHCYLAMRLFVIAHPFLKPLARLLLSSASKLWSFLSSQASWRCFAGLNLSIPPMMFLPKSHSTILSANCSRHFCFLEMRGTFLWFTRFLLGRPDPYVSHVGTCTALEMWWSVYDPSQPFSWVIVSVKLVPLLRQNFRLLINPFLVFWWILAIIIK